MNIPHKKINRVKWRMKFWYKTEQIHDALKWRLDHAKKHNHKTVFFCNEHITIDQAELLRY